MIASADLIAKFRHALDNDWGYIWGTAGDKWTAAKQANIEKTKDADREGSRKYGSQWIGHMVADCSGLFSWAFRELGGKIYHGSDTMYRKYTEAKGQLKNGVRTDGEGLKPGTAVFIWKEAKGKYTHVGLYVGDGMVIEAAGAKSGVIKGKVTASKWTHWGELKGVDYSGEKPDPKPEPEPEDEYPTIKRGSKGKWVTLAQVKLISAGYSCGPQGADGDFGSNTEKAVKDFQREHCGPDGRALTMDGIIGPATWWALNSAPQRITYTVTIRNLTTEQKDKLLKEYPNAEAKAE